MEQYKRYFSESKIKAPYKVGANRPDSKGKMNEPDTINAGETVETKVIEQSSTYVKIEVKQGKTIALLTFENIDEAKEEGWI